MANIKITVDTPLEQVEELLKGTLVDNLGIRITEFDQGRVVATMPVDHRTIQPAQILHGGATIALAETVSGFGSMLLIDGDNETSRGIQLSTSHISSATSGFVTGIATIIHKGRTTHIWDVNVYQEKRLISVIRVTNMIIKDSNGSVSK